MAVLPLEEAGVKCVKSRVGSVQLGEDLFHVKPTAFAPILGELGNRSHPAPNGVHGAGGKVLIEQVPLHALLA